MESLDLGMLELGTSTLLRTIVRLRIRAGCVNPTQMKRDVDFTTMGDIKVGMC